ncbi:MAG: N-acetyl-alpha-D-glucosaminyl L-malate synthase BshA [Candidatus Bathyarchaeota archaeon]|nr:MAG: N-acetyl-alpha-D-glucosaminyl L-malate synthase BshA [Candidatus Bathyarchaeota archaeon]
MSSTKLKIGITCYPTVGGSGILATRLGVELAGRGHEVHFITYERPVAIQGVDHDNVYVHLVTVVEYPLFKYPPYTIALGSEMFRVSQQQGLDLLHVHYSIPHATAALLARGITGVPYVVTLHGSDVTILGSDRSYLPVNTHSVEEADAVTAVSKFMAEEAYERLGITKEIAVIPNFVDSETFSPAPCEVLERDAEKDIVVAHISNFRPVKRVQDLIYAINIVAKKEPGVRLMLVGDGPERHKLEALIDHLDLRGNVQLTGYRSDVANLLRCSDAVVLCSETESAPLTLLEGMSCGLPVVATEVGGIPEIVEDGVNGFLVQPKHPEAIAQRILELSEDGALRRRLGEAARRTVLERYTSERVLSQYEEIYEKVVRG